MATEQKTKDAYSHPKVVRGYIAEHAANQKVAKRVERFAKQITGQRIIDVGCGPGHDSWHFARLGLTVTGIDFSPEMIEAAKTLENGENKPTFIVADMTKLTDLFTPNSFDAAWVCASLLHVERDQVALVLANLRNIVVPGGLIFIAIKKGDRDDLRVETKYGVQIERKFVLWQKYNFEKLLKAASLQVLEFDEEVKNDTFLNFVLRNAKT